MISGDNSSADLAPEAADSCGSLEVVEGVLTASEVGEGTSSGLDKPQSINTSIYTIANVNVFWARSMKQSFKCNHYTVQMKWYSDLCDNLNPPLTKM